MNKNAEAFKAYLEEKDIHVFEMEELEGDNLSVVDMMRERVSNEHGEYTFSSEPLTEPGRLMREPVFFGMESTDVVIQQQNASDAEIVVE